VPLAAVVEIGLDLAGVEQLERRERLPERSRRVGAELGLDHPQKRPEALDRHAGLGEVAMLPPLRPVAQADAGEIGERGGGVQEQVRDRRLREAPGHLGHELLRGALVVEGLVAHSAAVPARASASSAERRVRSPFCCRAWSRMRP